MAGIYLAAYDSDFGLYAAFTMYDLLNEITEIRTCCGFREKVIQGSTMPHRRSRFNLAWLIYS